MSNTTAVGLRSSSVMMVYEDIPSTRHRQVLFFTDVSLQSQTLQTSLYSTVQWHSLWVRMIATRCLAFPTTQLFQSLTSPGNGIRPVFMLSTPPVRSQPSRFLAICPQASERLKKVGRLSSLSSSHPHGLKYNFKEGRAVKNHGPLPFVDGPLSFYCGAIGLLLSPVCDPNII